MVEKRMRKEKNIKAHLVVTPSAFFLARIVLVVLFLLVMEDFKVLGEL